jgi:hypothetical protein
MKLTAVEIGKLDLEREDSFGGPSWAQIRWTYVALAVLLAAEVVPGGVRRSMFES